MSLFSDYGTTIFAVVYKEVAGTSSYTLGVCPQLLIRPVIPTPFRRQIAETDGQTDYSRFSDIMGIFINLFYIF
jgi:hypothetical protein